MTGLQTSRNLNFYCSINNNFIFRLHNSFIYDYYFVLSLQINADVVRIALCDNLGSNENLQLFRLTCRPTTQLPRISYVCGPYQLRTGDSTLQMSCVSQLYQQPWCYRKRDFRLTDPINLYKRLYKADLINHSRSVNRTRTCSNVLIPNEATYQLVYYAI